eukprot:jgi/Chlat1/7094/Chrsp57S06782
MVCNCLCESSLCCLTAKAVFNHVCALGFGMAGMWAAAAAAAGVRVASVSPRCACGAPTSALTSPWFCRVSSSASCSSSTSSSSASPASSWQPLENTPYGQRARFPTATTRRRRLQALPAATPDESLRLSVTGPRDIPTLRANVTPITPAAQASLLPLTATGAQFAYYWGSFDKVLQRLGISLLGTLLFYPGSVLLTVFAALYWLYCPVAQAFIRNLPVRRHRFAGLWRARLLGVRPVRVVTGVERFSAANGARVERPKVETRLRVIVGDGSGASVKFDVPLRPEYRDLRPGDQAELAILSDSTRLRTASLRMLHDDMSRALAKECPMGDDDLLDYEDDVLLFHETEDMTMPCHLDAYECHNSSACSHDAGGSDWHGLSDGNDPLEASMVDVLDWKRN